MNYEPFMYYGLCVINLYLTYRVFKSEDAVTRLTGIQEKQSIIISESNACMAYILALAMSNLNDEQIKEDYKAWEAVAPTIMQSPEFKNMVTYLSQSRRAE